MDRHASLVKDSRLTGLRALYIALKQIRAKRGLAWGYVLASRAAKQKDRERNRKGK